MGLKQEFLEHVGELKVFLRTKMRLVPWLVTAVFLLSAVGGFALYTAFPEEAGEVIDYFSQVVDDAGVLSEDGTMHLFPLMLNNWRAMVVSILYGLIPFIFLPITAAISNALIVGVLAAHYHYNGASLILFFAGILPHGIFEIPALILSISLGVVLCYYMVLFVCRHKRAVPMLELFSNILRTLLLVIFPLVVLSAVIEAYLTPLVMQLFA